MFFSRLFLEKSMDKNYLINRILVVLVSVEILIKYTPELSADTLKLIS